MAMDGLQPYFLTFMGMAWSMLLPAAPRLLTGAGVFPVMNDTTTAVINEIMADPTPVVGLPDAEWIELYNAHTLSVSLKGWKLAVGTTLRTLPDSTLNPGTYAVVCASKSAAGLQPFGKTVVLSSLPALRNSGNRISLTDGSGKTVDVVDYSDTWYRDARKKQGGWSLERIDPARSCGQQSNWCASTNPRGGTPVNRNSVYSENRDTVKPEIISVTTLSKTEASLLFSEPMDTLLLNVTDNYRLNGDDKTSVKILHSKATSVHLSWDIPLTENIPYQLHLLRLTDECGNPLQQQTVEIEWITLFPGDVVINELLFNPWPGGADFVEIYNNSAKHINPEKLMLASRNPDQQLTKIVSLKQAKQTLKPRTFLAVTTDTAGISAFYDIPCKNCLEKVPSLPAMNNDQGTVVLLSDSLTILDEVRYDEKMHHPLLYDTEGVSLERVNPALPSNDRQNWHSASSMSGFATPGYRNSQLDTPLPRKENVTFEQTAFSPDNDGFNDELIIRCSMEEPGWVANCHVFDINGTLVYQLLNNALMAAEETFLWNGEDPTGRLLPPGPYVVVLELFNINGKTSHYRKGIVLTCRQK